MSIFNKNSSRFWRNITLRAVVILSCVTLIVWLLPRNQGPMLHYDVNRPWLYGSLIAPFDFPVYKTDSAIKAEQDSLLRDFQPYYTFQADVAQRSVDNFQADYPGNINGIPPHIKVLLVAQLQRVYKAGIMQTTDYNRFEQDTTSMIRIVTHKAASGVKVNRLYSTMSAYESFFSDPTLMPYRQALQQLNLNNYILPNIVFDKKRTTAERDDLLSAIPQASGMVLNGQKIVDKGEMIDEYTYQVLHSFEKEMQRRQASNNEARSVLMGQAFYVALLFILFTIYLELYRKDYFNDHRKIMMLYTLITIFPILVSLMMRHNFFSVYILPFAMTPMFVRVFLDSRTAFMAHVTMVLICVAALKYPYEFMILQLVAGLIVILSMRELSKRAQIFQAALFVTLATCFMYFILQVMTSKVSVEQTLDFSMYYHFLVNGVLLLLAYPLMWLVEKTFGFVSSVTLFELSNTNRGLIRQLSQVAPGTFQHSITVSNLAEEIAIRIGRARPLLVRTGALYHDIGKMHDPVYFTENQVGVNPHKHLTNEESARKIIAHVTEGVVMAQKAHLPKDIIDFITTHHGRGLVKYFYINEQNAHPDVVIDKAPYCYPGPNPSTLEQAILMMADGVEAASRSLPAYTEENITKLVNAIIDNDIAEGFFNDCPVTFRDIRLAKEVLIERLKNIYHTRIQYPTLSEEAQKTTQKEEESKNPPLSNILDEKAKEANESE